VPSNGWFGINNNLLAYASSTNQDTIFGLGAGGNPATTTAGVQANVYIGYLAGSTDGGTSANTALGSFALQSNTNGLNNTAIGYKALQNQAGTQVSVNTAVGANALTALTTGAFNSSLGEDSGLHMTTGSRNTDVGYSADGQNTTGSDNASFGYGAGYSGAGDYERNTFIGVSSNQNSNAAILDTTELGYEAGYNNTGWNSTFLGEKSGQNVTSGNNNILIGYNALAPSPTASNQLNLGNIIFGTGLAATSSSASVIPTLTGKVGIATSTPSTLFQLFSTATTTISIDSNSSSQGACIEVKDFSGGGYTYLYTNAGLLYTSTISCK
jgi:hypothetical protein